MAPADALVASLLVEMGQVWRVACRYQHTAR
jgi:hypothetical protein